MMRSRMLVLRVFRHRRHSRFQNLRAIVNGEVVTMSCAEPLLRTGQRTGTTTTAVRNAWRSERGSAAIGWVLTAPLVLAVPLAATDVSRVAVVSVRAHAMTVRMAYALATETSVQSRDAMLARLARAACSSAAARWSEEEVSGVLMVAVHIRCHINTGVLGSRWLVAAAHAPLERP